jgi:hypothetical protein
MEAIFIDAADISFLKKFFYSPKLQLVVIFSKADMAVFPGLERPIYLLGLVAVETRPFSFFPFPQTKLPIELFA